jgi:hypothetical protein
LKGLAAVALCICLPVWTRADSLLLMPTARHLPQGDFRAELWTNDQLAGGFVSAGLGQSWDAQVSVDRFGADPDRPTASLAYYYLSPIADIAPGISGGILDAANETTDGRRIYACATLNRSVRHTASLGYTQLTAGIEVGRRSSPMAGLRSPVAKGLSLIAEYDGYRFDEALETKLGEGVYARLALRGPALYFSLGITR